MRRARPGELVEEARHGHRHEAHRDDAGFRFTWSTVLRSAQLPLHVGGKRKKEKEREREREREEGPGSLRIDVLFLAMTALRRALGWRGGKACRGGCVRASNFGGLLDVGARLHERNVPSRTLTLLTSFLTAWTQQRNPTSENYYCISYTIRTF